MKFHQSWFDFLEQIDNAISRLSFDKNEEIFYRGHSNELHTLTPGIFRNKDLLSSENLLWNIESDMFYEFRSRARDIQHSNITDWDILFFMQHHGVKTRLLDWTESLGVALYFALLEAKSTDSNPCIWLLNPYKLNESYHGYRDLYAPENLDDYDSNEDAINYSELLLYEEDVIPWEQPIALYPIRKVDRLTSQSGYFTIHGTDRRPIEKIIPYGKKIWEKVILPKTAIESANYFLEHAGINHFTMFPDLDGLSRFLNYKYFAK